MAGSRDPAIHSATEANWPQIRPFFDAIVAAGETYAYPEDLIDDQARAQGFRGIQFNAVVETNTAAVRLWERLGFRIVGTVPGAFRSRAHGYVGLHVMFLEL